MSNAIVLTAVILLLAVSIEFLVPYALSKVNLGRVFYRLWPLNPYTKWLARALYKQLRLTFQPEHEYKPVNLSEFQFLDLQYYQATRNTLEQLGFRFLVDIENRTLSHAHPENRTFTRIFVHEDQHIIATCYSIFLKKHQESIDPPSGRGRHVNTLDLETAFSTGTTVCTTNATMAKMDPCETEIQSIVPPKTSVNEMCAQHMDSAMRYEAKHPGAQPFPITNVDEFVAFRQRSNAANSAHRRRIGYVTQEEILRIAEPGGEYAAKALYQALQVEHEKARMREKRGELAES